VHPKTGKRWRLGREMTSSSGARLQYAPVVDTRKQVISERFLSEDDRVVIADLRGAGFGVRAIAALLGRSPSMVSRELRRNRDPGSGQYRPFSAQRLAVCRRARPGRGKLLRDRELREFVAGRLSARWSPEQVSQALRGEFPGDRGRHLVHETICQAVCRPELGGGLCRDVPRVLRAGRRHRKPRRRADARRPGVLAGMINISQRPAEAAGRSVAGHWEGDLVIGAGNRPAIGTLAGRASRFTILLHVPGPRYTAEAVADSRLQLARHVDRHARRRTCPLRQRPQPHRSHPDLGRPHRHPSQRRSPRSSALKRLPSTSISHRVATVTGIRGASCVWHGRPGAGSAWGVPLMLAGLTIFVTAAGRRRPGVARPPSRARRISRTAGAGNRRAHRHAAAG
jgi:transposase, IS30 family